MEKWPLDKFQKVVKRGRGEFDQSMCLYSQKKRPQAHLISAQFWTLTCFRKSIPDISHSSHQFIKKQSREMKQRKSNNAIKKQLNFSEHFLGDPKNKDHVSCFSILGGDDQEFFQVPKPLQGWGDVYHYELTCCVLTAHFWGNHLPKHSHF